MGTSAHPPQPERVLLKIKFLSMRLQGSNVSTHMRRTRHDDAWFE